MLNEAIVKNSETVFGQVKHHMDISIIQKRGELILMKKNQKSAKNYLTKSKDKLRKSKDQDRKGIISLLQVWRPAANAAPQSQQNNILRNTKMALVKLSFTTV